MLRDFFFFWGGGGGGGEIGVGEGGGVRLRGCMYGEKLNGEGTLGTVCRAHFSFGGVMFSQRLDESVLKINEGLTPLVSPDTPVYPSMTSLA